MNNSNFRVFEHDGKQYRFHPNAFKESFNAVKSRKELSVKDLEEEIASAIGFSADAVHNWRMSTNGPSSLDTVQKIADVLGLQDWTLLLVEIKEERVNNRRDEIELYAVKRIYDAVVTFMDEFLHTDGFNDYWHELFNEQPDPSEWVTELRLAELAERKYRQVLLAYKKEYMFLKDHPVYEELGNILYNEGGLQDCYEGKLSYMYRFEGPTFEPPHPTTEEDYLAAMKKVDDVIGRYF